jgi:spore maturation protein CgeB
MNVLFVALKYDYGKLERGESLEKRAFLPAIKSNCNHVETLWLEENGYPDDLDLVQENLIQFSNKYNPDLIFFILMKNEIKISTLKTLNLKFKTLNWFCDDQWRFENFTKAIAPHFSYSVTVDKFSITKYNNINCNVILSQWGTFYYNKNLKFENKYLYDITFVGSKNINREWVIYELKRRGIKVNCFGSGWSTGKISFEEMSNIFFQSKINLNLSNSVSHDYRFYIFLFKSFFTIFLNPLCNFNKRVSFLKDIKSLILTSKKVEQIKARNFEIPGCGGFQLTSFALQLEDYFINGTEISVFSEINELEILIKYFINHDNHRENIAYNGYLRSNKYTYEERIKELFNNL